MKTMILAAGEGRRLLPLTQHTPKPLLPLGHTTLIGYHVQRLAAAGFREVVINLAHLGAQIQHALGDGSGFGLHITYSPEPYPLETAGGIARALPLLGDAPFVLINGDVLTDYPLDLLRRPLQGLGHLILAPNPPEHPQGDFAVDSQGRLSPRGSMPGFTFSGISLLHPQLIASYPQRREKFALREVLDWGMEQRQLSAELYRGRWLDVGTPERLAQARTWF